MRSIVFLTSALLLVACGTEEEPTVYEPTLVSLTVDPASDVAGAEVMVMVEVADFTLSGESGHDDHDDMDMDSEDDDHDEDDAHEAPEGHVHIYWNSVETNPLLMLTESMGTIIIPEDAEVGVHTIIGRLQDEDHKIIEGADTLEVDFEVLAP